MKKRLEVIKSWFVNLCYWVWDLRYLFLNLKGRKRFVLMVVFIGISINVFRFGTGADYFVKEENYVAMENVVHSISEEKKIPQFDSKKIKNCAIISEEDGNFTVKVEGKILENVTGKLSSEYQIKGIERNYRYFVAVIYFILLVCIYGLMATIGLYALYYGVEFIIRFIRYIGKYQRN